MIDGMKELHREIEKTFNIDESNFNFKRAKQFEGFAQSRAKKGQLGLKPIALSTIKIQGFNHPPMFRYGKFIAYMQSKKHRDKSASAGYYVRDKTRYPNKVITYYKLAKIHTTGFRTRLGIVPPRPLVYNAFTKYHPKEKKYIKYLILKTWRA